MRKFVVFLLKSLNNQFAKVLFGLFLFKGQFVDGFVLGKFFLVFLFEFLAIVRISLAKIRNLLFKGLYLGNCQLSIKFFRKFLLFCCVFHGSCFFNEKGKKICQLFRIEGT